MTKFAKGDNQIKKNISKGDNAKIILIPFKFSPGNQLLILYKLSYFEAPDCNVFVEILYFACPNLQRAITKIFFFNFHQAINSLSAIS